MIRLVPINVRNKGNEMYYEILTDMNVLYDSFQKCKKSVDWKYSIQRYDANLLSKLIKIRKQLLDGTYKPHASTEFDINERGKTRHIKSPTITDRIVQRALCDYILEPLLYPKLIYNNGASIKGKGLRFSRDNLDKHLREYYRQYGNDGYILIGDYKSYFDSIPHDKLFEMLTKRIKDERVMGLITDILHSFSGNDNKGLGIGAHISQILGVFYATPIDIFCTTVKGYSLYGRHMDDFYIISNNKAELKEMIEEITKESQKLGLTINRHKTQIYRLDKGFKYLKQRIILTDTGEIIHKPCKANITRERRKLKAYKRFYQSGHMPLTDIINSYKSWRGAMSDFNCHYAIKNTDKLFNALFSERRKT